MGLGERVGVGDDAGKADSRGRVEADAEVSAGGVYSPAGLPLADESAIEGNEWTANCLAEQVVRVVAGVERDGIAEPGGACRGFDEVAVIGGVVGQLPRHGEVRHGV